MNNTNFYKFTFKDGSTLGTIASGYNEARETALCAPGQREGTITGVEVREQKRWCNVFNRGRREDDKKGAN